MGLPERHKAQQVTPMITALPIPMAQGLSRKGRLASPGVFGASPRIVPRESPARLDIP